MPGPTRIEHGIHAATDPEPLHLLVECNAYFGVLPDLEEHPLPRLVDAGVAVTPATDNPVQLGATIAQEYAEAAALGMSVEQLTGFTRNAIRAAFTSDERESAMLAEPADARADRNSPAPAARRPSPPGGHPGSGRSMSASLA